MSLPANTLTKTTANRMGLEQYAAHFYAATVARALPQPALDCCLDITALLKGLRSEYLLYRDYVRAVPVDPEDALAKLSPETQASLSPEKRRQLVQLIWQEVSAKDRVLGKMLEFLDAQLGDVERASDAFHAAAESRLQEHAEAFAS